MAKAVRLADYLTAIPDHPINDPAPLSPAGWPMDRNDQAGVCAVAAADHAIQAQTVQLGVPRRNWDDATILRYYQTQNPRFRSWMDSGGPYDNGMVLQELLDVLVSDGTILAYGAVDLTIEDEFKAAVWLGLGVITGEMLTSAQQTQLVWDYVPGDDEWGGHATATVGYQGWPDESTVITWGQPVSVTEDFRRRQIEEAWFVLTPDLVNHAGFRNHFDLSGFADAVLAVTDGKVVVPVDPPVPVDPGPVPALLDDFPFAAVNDWARRPHIWRKATLASRQYLAWLERHRLD